MKENPPIKIKNDRIHMDAGLMRYVDYLIGERKIEKLFEKGEIRRLTKDNYFEFEDWGAASYFIKIYLPALKKEIKNKIYYLHNLQKTKDALEDFVKKYSG